MLRKCPLDPIAANWISTSRGMSCLVTGRREIGMLYRTISVGTQLPIFSLILSVLLCALKWHRSPINGRINLV
jgi:hypothetical protein